MDDLVLQGLITAMHLVQDDEAFGVGGAEPLDVGDAGKIARPFQITSVSSRSRAISRASVVLPTCRGPSAQRLDLRRGRDPMPPVVFAQSSLQILHKE